MVGAAQPALPSEWDRFRGPNGPKVAESGPLPVTFGPGANVVWTTSVPPGYSSPILTSDAILLTAFEDSHLLTISLDRRTGRERWRHAVDRPRSEPLDPRNHPTAPSPVVDAADGDEIISSQEFPHESTRGFIPVFDLEGDGALNEADWGY